MHGQIARDDRVSDDQSRTMVVGGLPSHKTEDECKSWLLQNIQQQCNATVIDVFSKVMFWKSDSMSVRNLVLSTLSKSRLSFNSAAIWMSGDAPLPVRVKKKYLFGPKRLLQSWGWQMF